MSIDLSLENVCCGYEQKEVIHSLFLQVAQGERLCLLGSSGCGKTTLLKAIAGLLPIDSGPVSYTHLTLPTIA